MALLNCVFNAIILGFYLYIYKYFLSSSHKDGDFDSCFGSLETECKICDSATNRVLVEGKCMCNNGTYDDGINNFCADCHFSWFFKPIFKIL